ncbi:hypothetical protein BOX15_Mlig017782g1, partial [Macrostomum lignano]
SHTRDSAMSGMRLDCKIYVGELPRDAEEREIQRTFKSFGRIRNVWVARNPPGFAFVEMEDPRDAEKAARSLDGSVICGVRARVEMSSGRSRPKSRRGFDPDDRCYDCGARGHYAYNCPKTGRGRGAAANGRDGSRERRRGRRSPSNSDRSDSRSRSRSRSPPPRRKR